MRTVEKLAISVSEAAEILGISRPTLYQLIQRDDFPSFRVGRRTLINRALLQAWLDKEAGKVVKP